MGVAQSPSRHAINPPEMTPNQIGEGRIGPIAMLIEKLDVGHCLYNCRVEQKRTAPRFLRNTGRCIHLAPMSEISFDIDAVIEGNSRLTEAQALELYHNA